MLDIAHRVGPIYVISRRPLLSFFGLTFLISPLLFLGPMLLVAWGGPGWLESVGGILVAWAPTIAALIVSGVSGGRGAVGRLLAGFLRWRVNWRWYLLAILGPVLFIYLAAILLIGAGGPAALSPACRRVAE